MKMTQGKDWGAQVGAVKKVIPSMNLRPLSAPRSTINSVDGTGLGENTFSQKAQIHQVGSFGALLYP